MKYFLTAFYHCPDTLSAIDLMYFTTVYNHSNFLQVWAESAVRGAQRKAAIVTESRGFPARFTFSHCLKSFPYYNYTQIASK